MPAAVTESVKVARAVLLVATVPQRTYYRQLQPPWRYRSPPTLELRDCLLIALPPIPAFSRPVLGMKGEKLTILLESVYGNIISCIVI